MVSCRICKGDHWTTRCPYKDTLQPINEAAGEADGAGRRAESAADGQGNESAQRGGGGGGAGGKYVPPSMREGGNRRGESMSTMKKGI